MDHTVSKKIEHQFEESFSHSPTLKVHAPGRINLIGEHTDYNQGFVLPAAINKCIYFSFAKNNINQARFFAYDKGELFKLSLLENVKDSFYGWQKYVVGMTRTFLPGIQGFDCVFGGDLPHGAGMSSSSALCCGLAYGLNLLFDLGHNKEQMIPLIQKAEAECSGVNGGIMDQFSIMMGQKDKAILLDCRDLKYNYLPLKLEGNCLLLCNTGVEHKLADTEYNTRRKECEAGIALLEKLGESVKSLRDVNMSMLEKHQTAFDPIVYKRCKYVINENERVLNAVNLLKLGKLAALGKSLYESHKGLKSQYEVSCPELDFLVAFSHSQHYVLGSRMMGGGFGGCTINLLPIDKVNHFLSLVEKAYLNKFGIELESYQVVTGSGVH
ncbi:MAG: galactokinase [Saprospiraceae bacterium]